MDIQNKKIKDLNLRVNKKTRFYGYGLCDDTTNIEEHILMEDLIEAPEGRSFFNYYKGLNAYIQLITYDKVISNAKKRHQIFFQKLGID